MKFLSLLLSIFLPFLAFAAPQSPSWTGYVIQLGGMPLSQSGPPATLATFSTALKQLDSNPLTLNGIQPKPLTPLTLHPLTITADNQTVLTVNSINSNATLGIYPVDVVNQTALAPIPTTLNNNVFAHPTDPTIAYVWGYEEATIPVPFLGVVDLTNGTIPTTIQLPASGNSTSYSNFATAIVNGIPMLYLVEQAVENPAVIPFDISNPTNPSMGPAIPLKVSSSSGITTIVIAPNTTTAYVASFLSNQLTPVDLLTNTAGTPITFSQNFTGAIAISPDGSKIYAIALNNNLLANALAIFDTSSQTFASNTIAIPIHSMSLGGIDIDSNGATSVAFTPDGLLAYVTVVLSNETTFINGDIVKIDATTDTVIATFPAGVYPANIVFASQPETAVFAADPLAGPASGGTLVTITGTGFTGTTSVLFGSNPATFTQISDNQVVAVSPPGEPGTIVPITVVTPHGKSRLSRSCCHAYLPSTFEPTNLRGFQTKNEFATQTDRINSIRWSPPSHGDAAVSYEIYRNEALTDLIATIPGEGPLEFREHNRRKKAYTYYIVSINEHGHHSLAASLTIVPQ